MKKSFILFICMITYIMLLLTGCSPFVEKHFIEEIAPVLFWSIEEVDEEQLKVSTLVPPLIKEKKELLVQDVHLLKENTIKFNANYYRQLKSGQLRMLFLHENVAKQGLNPIINTILRDSDISQRLFLVVVKGNFNNYFNEQLNKQEDLDFYLYNMLKHYENQGKITIVNLHQFKKRLYSHYSDPILPVFYADANRFTYEGTALFQNDKLVEHLQNIEEQMYQLIGNYHFLDVLPIPSLSVSLGNVRTVVHTNFNRDLSELSITIRLVGRIDEYKGELNSEKIVNLNDEIKAYLENKTLSLLNKMQNLRVDPLEIGARTLTPFSASSEKEEWLNKWANMSITVTYDLHIESKTNLNKR